MANKCTVYTTPEKTEIDYEGTIVFTGIGCRSILSKDDDCVEVIVRKDSDGSLVSVNLKLISMDGESEQ